MTQQTDNKNNKSNKNNTAGCVVAILVGAGILFAVTSFAEGGGMAQPAIAFFAGAAIVIVILIGVITGSSKQIERRIIADSSDSQDMLDSVKEQPSQGTSKAKTTRLQVLIAATVFGIIGIIVVYLYLYRENTGVNVEWVYRTKPEDSPIVEVLAHETNIRVKTQSGDYYYTSPYYCEENCWNTDGGYPGWEKNAINDPSCRAKSSPPPPPEGQIRDEFIFRTCEFVTEDTRILIAKDGGLWLWYKWISSPASIFAEALVYSVLVAPLFSLIGVLIVNAFRATKK